MCPTAFFAANDEEIVIINGFGNERIVNPRLALLRIDEFCHRRARIDGIERYFVLMAITFCHHQAVGGLAIDDFGDIIIGIHRHIHRFQRAIFHIIAHHTHLRVLATGFGILIIVSSGIKAIFLDRIACSVIHLHRIHRHARFIPSYKRKCQIVGSPGKRIEQSKFFLIHPIGNTIDYFIHFAVFGHRHHASVIEFFDIDVVLMHKSHHTSIGRECGYLFTTLIAELGHLIMTNFIHIVVGSKRVAIYRLHIGIEQYFALIFRHHKSAEVLHIAVACSRCIKHHALASCLKVYLQHLRAAAKCVITHTVGRGGYRAYSFLSLPQHGIAKCECLGICHQRHRHHQHQQRHFSHQFHCCYYHELSIFFRYTTFAVPSRKLAE